MKSISMGLNTEPNWTKADKARANWEGNLEMLAYWDRAEKDSLALKRQIEKAMEQDGECSLSWSCSGRTRHTMHACQWQEALAGEHPDWKWEIDDNYKCVITKH